MEMTYFTTRNFVRRDGNVVDFQEYKQKKEEMERLSQEDRWAEAPVVSQETIERPARKSLLRKIGDCLDAAASLALAISAVTAVMLLF